MKLKRSLLAAAAIALALLGFGTARHWLGAGGEAPPGIQGAAYAQPRTIPEFELVGQDGEKLERTSLLDHWTLLYFGYTYCPDVCPTTLQTLGAVQRRLEERNAGDQVEVLFVSVDPKRDTPERLAQYAPFFGPRVRGATGDPAHLSRLTEALGVVYAQVGDGGDPGYLVDHSSAVLLIDPEARLYAVMTAPHSVDQLLTDFLALREYHG
jgi:protein SCO1/2